MRLQRGTTIGRTQPLGRLFDRRAGLTTLIFFVAASLFASTCDANAQAPTVTAVSPNTGTAANYNLANITITGTNFTNVTGVSFGGVAALDAVVNSSTSITATAQAVGVNGARTVDVTVTTTAGTSPVSAADQFTYVFVAPNGKLDLTE